MNWNSRGPNVTKRDVDRVKNPHPTAPLPSVHAAAAILLTALLLLLAGCATTPPEAPVEPAPGLAPPPAPPPVSKPKPRPVPVKPAQTPPVATAQPPVETSAPPLVPATAEKLTIRIESSPQGAMILVDGRPIGRAPIDVEVESASNGFFKAPVTIRARFVATDASTESFSIDEQLTPLERVPLALVFSHEGTQRILRRF